MTHHHELTALRRYTRQEAANLLNIPDTWLKVWVTDRKVPHQRSGKPGPRQRGVWFNDDDIREIGRMLPGLQSVHQANSRAESTVGDEPTEVAHPHGSDSAAQSLPVHISDDELERLRGLTSLRRS